MNQSFDPTRCIGSLKLGLLGQTLGHSRSQPMWNALLPDICPGATYENVETQPFALAEALCDCAWSGFHGLNVTVPYKEAVAAWVGHLEGCAAETGATNCIRFPEPRRHASLLAKEPGAGWGQGAQPENGADSCGPASCGYNTDGPAIRDSLLRTNAVLHSALVLGAGGAARSAVWALQELDVRRIAVMARKGADQLPWFTNRGVEVMPWDNTLNSWEGDVVVQATPLGFESLAKGVLPQVRWSPGMVAVDLVYGDPLTEFLATAVSRGAGVVDGLEILARQAAEAWFVWSGHRVNWQEFRLALG